MKTPRTELALLCATVACTEPVVVGELPAPPTRQPIWRMIDYLKPRAHEVNAEFGRQVAWLDDTLAIAAPLSGDCGLDPTKAGYDLRCRREGILSLVPIPAVQDTPYTLRRSSAPGTNAGFGGQMVVTEDAWFVASSAYSYDPDGDGDADEIHRTGQVEVIPRINGDFGEPIRLLAADPRPGAQLGYAITATASRLVAIEPNLACPEGETCPSQIAVHIFERVGDQWVSEPPFVPDAFGVPFGAPAARPRRASVAMDGTQIVVGLPYDDPCSLAGDDPCPYAGSVRILERIDGGWRELHRVTAEDAADAESGSWFGASLALTDSRLFVGEVGTGKVWIFDRATYVAEDYVQNQDPNVYFGFAIDAEPGRLLVGAPHERNCEQGIEPVNWDDGCSVAGVGPGAAFVYELEGTHWVRRLYVKPTTSRPWTEFGYSVGLRGHRIAIGAPGEANLGQGVGRPGQEGSGGVGAVFVYEWK
ncbi:MAG: hypothetical protein RIT81_13540 [Deltaproteobacteria bacterium]